MFVLENINYGYKWNFPPATFITIYPTSSVWSRKHHQRIPGNVKTQYNVCEIGLVGGQLTHQEKYKHILESNAGAWCVREPQQRRSRIISASPFTRGRHSSRLHSSLRHAYLRLVTKWNQTRHICQTRLNLNTVTLAWSQPQQIPIVIPIPHHNTF